MTQNQKHKTFTPHPVTVADHLPQSTLDALSTFNRQHILAAARIHAAATKTNTKTTNVRKASK